jgi:hypothetical protein
MVLKELLIIYKYHFFASLRLRVLASLRETKMRKIIFTIVFLFGFITLFAQTLTYMRLGGFKLGLLINFNVLLLKQGIKRIINGKLE